jgi:cobyrinic acid a,c-diamide synthase
MKPQILISSANSSSGKTLFAMGLLRLLKKRGLKVQSYKCGPDFIDAQQLSIAADNDTVNLDAWMSSHSHVQFLYNKYGEQADVCATEGVGGLFDGYRRMQGSSAEMAQLLNLPIVLLVNARGVGYSVAPLIYGFKHFYVGVQIIGIVFNQVSSPAHYTYLKEACMDAGVDCLGYIPYNAEFKLPSKHSSITLTSKRAMDVQISLIADDIEKNVNINRLLANCNRNFPCQYTLPYSSDIETEIAIPASQRIKIAIARDPAFNFIYKENIARLSLYGTISYFSPVYGSELPEADLIYLPGGYPELFARQLHRRHKLMDALKAYAENGGKILAECGGMVFLGRSLTAKEGGTSYEMCNILPLDFSTSPKLNSGYRKLTYNGVELKGYEFHYSTINNNDDSLISTHATNMKGNNVDLPIYRYKNVIASYGHWYWGNMDILDLWK